MLLGDLHCFSSLIYQKKQQYLTAVFANCETEWELSHGAAVLCKSFSITSRLFAFLRPKEVEIRGRWIAFTETENSNSLFLSINLLAAIEHVL